MQLLDRLDHFALARQRAVTVPLLRQMLQEDAVEAGAHAMNLALFDLDGTLLPIDSDHAFGEFMVRLGWVDGERLPPRATTRSMRSTRPSSSTSTPTSSFATAPWRERAGAGAGRGAARASCAR